MSRKGFTLLELLVVVGILALLLGLLAPALAAAQRAGRSTVCLSNLRQIGLAARLYAQDHRDHLPRSSHSALAHGVLPWGYALSPYLGKGAFTGPGPAWESLFNGLYRCPQDSRRDRWSYGKSVWFELTSAETGEIVGAAAGPTYDRFSAIRRPAATILFGEVASGAMADHVMAHFWYMGASPEIDAQRHGTTSNYAFVDGHAEARVFPSTFNPNSGIDLWNPAQAR